MWQQHEKIASDINNLAATLNRCQRFGAFLEIVRKFVRKNDRKIVRKFVRKFAWCTAATNEARWGPPKSAPPRGSTENGPILAARPAPGLQTARDGEKQAGPRLDSKFDN